MTRALRQASQDGATPAYIAAQSGFHRCLDVLAALGADMRRPDRRGSTPLHQAWLFRSRPVRAQFR